MVKTMVKKEEQKTEVPVGGYHEVWKAIEANALIISGEYRVQQVCDNGKYILRRIK